jgi:hypothetical protein
VSESIQHSQLVERLLQWTNDHYPTWEGMPVVITADHTARYDGRRPRRIGEAIPDIYATSLPVAFCLIGEAKTTFDLETTHSQNQILCFLEYLRYQEHPFFVLATPWNLINTARNLVRVLVRRVEAQSVNLVFLQDIQGMTPRNA